MPGPEFEIDWHAVPADVVAAVVRPATCLETPCGDGAMVWHRWDGPKDSVGPDGLAPIVLLHGGWGSWTHWIRTIPKLAAARTIYVADLPGMGASANAPQPHSAETLSAIVTEGIDTLLPGGAPYHAVCFSFGGVMGTWAAARHGDRCRSLTLVGAAGFGDLHFVVMGVQVPDSTLPDAEIDAIHRNNLSLLMFAEADRIDPLALHIHRANIARGRVRTRRVSLSSALVEALPRVVSPMGGIWGEADSTGGGRADIEKRRDMLRAYQPDCAFDIIEGAGHWIMYEAADIFADTLFRQLQTHEDR